VGAAGALLPAGAVAAVVFSISLFISSSSPALLRCFLFVSFTVCPRFRPPPFFLRDVVVDVVVFAVAAVAAVVVVLVVADPCWQSKHMMLCI
jgi:hypothetical protein